MRQREDSAAARVQAANILLDRGWGKPPQAQSAATMIEVWHWSAAYGTHLEPGCWTAAIGSGLTRAYRR